MHADEIGFGELGLDILHRAVHGVTCVQRVDDHIILQRLDEVDVRGLQLHQTAVALHEEDLLGGVLVLHQGEEHVPFAQHLRFLFVFVQRHFDRRMDVDLLEGLDDVSVGLGDLGLGQGALIRVGGEEDHRDVGFLPDGIGGFYPVHLALEHDVHEDDVRHVLLGEQNGLFPSACGAHHVIPQLLQAELYILAHNALILHYEDVRLRHFRSS